jgi:hypothetical protein
MRWLKEYKQISLDKIKLLHNWLQEIDNDYSISDLLFDDLLKVKVGDINVINEILTEFKEKEPEEQQ